MIKFVYTETKTQSPLSAAFSYDEKNLLSQLSNNSDEAFRCLYERHWAKIYAVSLLYLKDKSLAEDIVQETFLRIWKNRTGLPEIHSLQHYLQTIARNLIISMLRKKMPLFNSSLETSDAIEEDKWKPSEQLEAKQIAELIKTAVSQLSPKHKQIYILSSETPRTLKELAVDLNISYDTARQYKSEALKYIRSFLAENACQLPFLVVATIFF
ncbi:MAG: sigma-70 family RNA polymerase sigma factor [Agriterribacter sp.]